jgi:hypothetical protein
LGIGNNSNNNNNNNKTMAVKKVLTFHVHREHGALENFLFGMYSTVIYHRLRKLGGGWLPIYGTFI